MLEQGAGGPLPPPPPGATTGGGGRRKGLIIGGAVVGVLALGGGGAFAAFSMLSGGGPQASEALPSSTIGYLTVDMDPSAGQKIEAFRTLRKFPAFADFVDINPEEDLRERIVEEILADAPCEGLTFEDDVEPWLGHRFALAAVDLGEDEPAPVGVLQVSDADGAEQAFEDFRACGTDEGDEGGEGGWAISDEWAVIAETSEIAEQVAEDATESSLADDGDFQRWTDAAGDPGIVQGYVSPDAGRLLAEEFGDLAELGGGFETPDSSFGGSDGTGGDIDECFQLDPVNQSEEFQACVEAGGLGGSTGEDSGDDSGLGGAEEMVPDVDAEALTSMFEDFQGAAMNIRFDDGSVEVEFAVDGSIAMANGIGAGEDGDAMIRSLPEDTAVAFGAGFEPGWTEGILEYYESILGDSIDLEEFIAQAEAETGLSLPEDIETLLGESAAVGVGSDIDPEELSNSADGLSELPVGVKIQGDTGEIEGLVGELLALDPSGEAEQFVGSDVDGDVIAIGPSEEYRRELLEDGGLGDTDTYQNVVGDEDASSVFFVNFDAGDGWLDNVLETAGAPEGIKENLEPLDGFGVIGWQDDDVNHTVLKLTTD